MILLALATSLALTDYDADVRRLEQQLAGARTATERAVYAYRRASLTGDFGDFRDAETAIETALRESPSAELVFLRASFNFKMHRLSRAKDDLARLGDRNAARMLGAQIALQEGDYPAALAGYDAAIASRRTWEGLANLAYYRASTGDPDVADRLYVEAEDEITAKEMRSYAWVELQRGLVAFDRRRYADALGHYRRADAAYSGYWLVEEHIAEVLDRLGRSDEAIALYRRLVERTHDPEFVDALAAIVGRERPEDAARLYAEADALHAESFRLYPEAAGGHLIRHLLARPDASPERLVALAEANAALRPNGEAKLLLAKAYRRVGRTADADRVVTDVMRTPWRTTELLELGRELADGSRGPSSPRPGA